ncbi:MAG: hypothetical protein AAF492_31070, partial [Verrucomicrobiota bacterium]
DDNDEDEFIVLHNPNPFDISLETEAGPWRIDGTVDFVFPSNTVFPAMSSLLIVSFDPADGLAFSNFLFTYNLTNGQVAVYGPWSGRLDNHRGRVAVERPQRPDLISEDISWVIVDEMIYFDRNPWPIEADGNGASLHRINDAVAGTPFTNWVAGSPTPATRLVGFLPLVGNTNGATGVGSFGAVLNGALLSTGSAPATVTLYWGTNDAGKTVSAWDASTNLGQSAPGSLATPVGGLSQNTTYYYRYQAENAIGASWAFPAVSFKTLGPPAVANTGVIVSAGSAQIQGALTDGTAADVTVYWGMSDGGTNPVAWDDQLDLGTLSQRRHPRRPPRRSRTAPSARRGKRLRALPS